MSRASILRGPCKITYNSQVFWSKGDVVVNHVVNTFPIQTSRFGKVDDRVDSVMDVLDFELDGRFNSAALSTIFPFASAVIGSSVFGTDTTLTINSVDGQQRVYVSAAVTKMPGLRLARKATIFGPMQITCLYGTASAPDDAGSLYTDSAVAYPGDTGYAVSDIPTQVYALDWGITSPWDAFSSKDGVTVDFKLDLAAEESESHGMYDYIFQGLEVSAKLQPDGGPAESDVLAALMHQGTGAVLGRSLNADSANLNIVGTGVYVRLYNANIVNFKELFSGRLRRMGDVEFRATRTVTTGTLDPLFHVGAAAP